MNRDASLAVRDIAPEDYEGWKPLWDGYNAFYGREGATALPAEVTRTTWQRFFDPAEPVFGLVADDGGRIVGITHYLYHRSTTATQRVCYLQDLFTVDAARGQGVARKLIEAVGAEAKKAGAPRLYWHTRESNTVARILYDKVAQNIGGIVYFQLL